MQRQIIQTASIWRDGVDLPTYSPLTTDLRVAVAVVGAGIAGLSTAYQLAKRGFQVAVLDDGPIGGGDIGNTTAQVTYMLDKGYAETEQLRGADGARLTAESHVITPPAKAGCFSEAEATDLPTASTAASQTTHVATHYVSA